MEKDTAIDEKALNDHLDGLWAIAQKKFGDAASRNPPKELEQIKSMLKGIEAIFANAKG